MSAHKTYEFGPFRMDLGRQILTRDGETVPLAPKPFSLLAYFVRHPDRVLSKEKLIDVLWKGSVGSEANLNVNIAAVRRALGERPQDHRYVVTVPLRGYSFVADLRLVTAASDASTTSPVTPMGKSEGPPDGPRRLAVLPSSIANPGPEDDHLGTGFADAITARMPQLLDWSVQSPQTVRRIASDGTDPLVLGRSLQVDAVLSGHIDQGPEHFSIDVRLRLVGDGSVLWGDIYTEAADDLARLPHRIADDLTRALKGSHPDSIDPRSSRRCPNNQAAFQECLKGRFLMERAGDESLMNAIGHFQKAQELDPDHGLVYAGEADAYYRLWRFGQLPAQTAVKGIESAARRAIELDEALAEPYFWLAYINMAQYWNWPVVETLFKRGLQNAPNSSLGHTLYSYYLTVAKRPEEAVETAWRGLQLEPTNLNAYSTVGNVLLLTGHVAEAVEQFRTLTEMEPQYVWGRLLSCWTLLAAEHYERATDELESIRKMTGEIPWVLAGLSFARARVGDADTARTLIEKLELAATRGFVEPYILAFAYHGLRDRDQTLKWLEEACGERHPGLFFLGVEPLWKPLWGDPGFQAILDRIGAPSA